MSRDESELTDAMWARIGPLLPETKASSKGGSRRISNRDCFEGILWVLRSGARWKDLPKRYPSPSTCWRRLRDWEEQGVWLRIWRVFLKELDANGQLQWHEVFADGTFASAKKGVPTLDQPVAERVRSLWWWQTARVFLWECNLPRPLLTK